MWGMSDIFRYGDGPLGAVALFAEGPTTIRNVAHIRHKSLTASRPSPANCAGSVAEIAEFDDGLTITPRPLHGAVVQTYDDHRMAIEPTLVGLRVPGVIIAILVAWRKPIPATLPISRTSLRAGEEWLPLWRASFPTCRFLWRERIGQVGNLPHEGMPLTLLSASSPCGVTIMSA